MGKKIGFYKKEIESLSPEYNLDLHSYNKEEVICFEKKLWDWHKLKMKRLIGGIEFHCFLKTYSEHVTEQKLLEILKLFFPDVGGHK